MARDIYHFHKDCAHYPEATEQIVKHNQMRRVLRVIEAAFESDKLGKTVDFEEV